MSDRSSDQDTLKDAAGPRTLTDEQVARLWETFKSGGAAHCPRDGAPLALAVDAQSKSYRLVCTRCGNASGWFETSKTGIHVRGAETLAPGALTDE